MVDRSVLMIRTPYLDQV